MRKFLSIFLIALLGMTTAYAQSNVTLTFACQTTDGGYLQPDSIIIENLTRNWSETIYYPDTVYTLNVGTSVPSHLNDNGMQVMPNPFDGTTRVNIQSQRTENVKMRLTDMLGRVCAEYDGLLQEGGNLFSISLTTPQTYVLSVQTLSGIRSLKMENVGRSSVSRIVYEGVTGGNMPVVQLKSSSSHAFELGDEMSFTVYAYLNNAFEAHQTVMLIPSTDDNIVVFFPVVTDTLNMSFCQVSFFNPKETGFNNQLSHVQDDDGNQYQVVQIGNKCWMKENLRTTHLKDGTTIPINTWSISSTTPYRNAPYNDENNVPIYGYLYNWPAVMQNSAISDGDPSGVQGICPMGWHVPSERELNNLPNNAKSLADSLGWAISSVSGSPGNNPSSNNASGFSLRPAGCYTSVYGCFDNPGHECRLWCTNGDFIGAAGSISISNTSSLYSHPTSYRHYGLSVRCVRDDLRAEVVTDSIIIVSDSSVVVRGTILSDHGIPITGTGTHCTSPSYFTQYDVWTGGDGNGTSYFYYNLDGLLLGIPYRAQSYASNSAGLAYGKSIMFAIPNPLDTHTCPNSSTVTDYDGNIYNTVQLGSQCWMKENLRTTHYSEGTSIPLGDTYSSQTAYRFYPNNDSSLTSAYGFLYNWNAVINGTPSGNNPSGVQGICPAGWHVPSWIEWELLRRYVITQSDFACGNDQTYIAKSIADSTGWNINSTTCTPGNNQEFNNSTNFGIRPAGKFHYNGFGGVGDNAGFWTASSYSSTTAYYYFLNANNPFFPEKDIDGLGYGYSVRCVKD